MKTKIKMKTCAYPGCENQFKPRFRTTEKFCSSECTWKDHKDRQNRRNRPKPVPKPIASRSKKRSKQERVYAAKRIAFLSRPENKYCAVYPTKRANQVHHKKGRIGLLLIDERFWLAVSPEGHEYIEKHPEEAKEKGWSLSRLAKNDGEEIQTAS